MIRKDLLRTGLADLLVAQYFEPMKEELAQRLERAKRYRPYMHPEASHLSVRAVWERFVPAMVRELESLQAIDAVSPSTFTHLARLYQQQQNCPPEFVRRVLAYQHQQSPWLKADPRLQYEDLSLFGFHSASDWFGRDFVDLSAEFILNAARKAEEKGYRVTIEEAKGDLLRNFHASMQRFSQMENKPDLNFKEHLRRLGFDEKSAAEVWRSVLLFRRYFHGVGEATFIDRLPYRNFASYALEKAVVQVYQWPPSLRLKNFQDFVELQVYLRAVSGAKDSVSLPSSFLSIDEVEKKWPELVQTSFRSKVARCSKGEAGLKASVKEVWDWETDEKNWEALRAEYPSLSGKTTREERFQILEKLDSSIRLKLDRLARLRLVEQNPDWIGESLASAPTTEKTISVSKDWISLAGVGRPGDLEALLERASIGDAEAIKALSQYPADGNAYYRIEGVEKIQEKYILTLEEAKRQGILAKVANRFLEAEYLKVRSKSPAKFQRGEGEWKAIGDVKEEVVLLVFSDLIHAIGGASQNGAYWAAHRLEISAKEAAAAFQKNPEDPRWLQRSGDPLADQFKLVKKETEIQRTTEEEWMKEQAFVMVPKQWSPVHVPSDGDISFFYFEEKRPHANPILEQMVFGKETIGADAERYVAERLIETAKKKNSIVIPLQMEKE